MASCVNISSAEFNSLFKELYGVESKDFPGKKHVLAARIKNWQEANDTTNFPSVVDIQQREHFINKQSTIAIESDFDVEPVKITRNILINVPAKFENNKMGFTQEAVKTISQAYFNQLFSNPQRILELFSGELNNNLHQVIVQEVRALVDKFVNERFNAVTDKSSQKFLDFNENWLKLYENLDQILELQKKELSKYNIEVISQEVINNGENKDSNELWVTESLKYSSKQQATSNTRLLIGSLTKGKSFRNPLFGGTELVDFGKTFNFLANKLSNSKDIKQIEQIILDNLGVTPGLETLHSRVFDNKNSASGILNLLQMAQTFSKHYNNYLFSFVGENGVT
jgi:hypothetical protein